MLYIYIYALSVYRLGRNYLRTAAKWCTDGDHGEREESKQILLCE